MHIANLQIDGILVFHWSYLLRLIGFEFSSFIAFGTLGLRTRFMP